MRPASVAVSSQTALWVDQCARWQSRPQYAIARHLPQRAAASALHDAHAGSFAGWWLSKTVILGRRSMACVNVAVCCKQKHRCRGEWWSYQSACGFSLLTLFCLSTRPCEFLLRCRGVPLPTAPVSQWLASATDGFGDLQSGSPGVRCSASICCVRGRPVAWPDTFAAPTPAAALSVAAGGQQPSAARPAA